MAQENLTPEQIQQLEAALTNFITKLKGGQPTPGASPQAMMMPIGRGHGSHYQE